MRLTWPCRAATTSRSTAGSGARRGRAGPRRERPDQEAGGDREVGEGLDRERRRERRVVRVVDPLAMRKSFSASPARAGTTAFTPTPAAYAPKTWRVRTREPGNAAARMLRQATERDEELRDVQQERYPERREVDPREVMEERPGGVPDLDHGNST